MSIAATSGRARVHAIGRLLSLADTTDKGNADLAIEDVTKGFVIAESGSTTTVHCGNGTAHGSAAGNDAGCEALAVALPAGAAGKPLSVTAQSGRGSVLVSLAAAFLGALEVRGSGGTIDVTAPTTQGASILVIAETGDDVVLRLPSDFAADTVSLETSGAIDTRAFPDVQSGRARGVAGAGAKLITVRSVGVGSGSSAGRITLAAY